MLRTTAVLAVLIGIATLAGGEPAPAARPRLLVVTVTKGFRHASIPTAESVLQKLAETSGAFSLDFARTDDELKEKTGPEGLKGYAGAVFASTTGDLPLTSPAAFLEWIASGRAFVGIHSASDTFHGFPAFLDMLGGEFDRHGEQARVHLGVEDLQHPAARDIAFPPSVLDEIYLFKRFDPGRVHIVLALDKHPNTGEAGFYPIAWTREQGRGRIFYTALGHREDVLESDWYGKHLLGGIRWALDATTSAR